MIFTSHAKSSIPKHWHILALLLTVFFGTVLVAPHILLAATVIRGDLFKLNVSWKRGLLFYGGFEGWPKWQTTMHPNTSDQKYAVVVRDPKKPTNKVLRTTYLKGSYSSDTSPVGTSATIFRMNFKRSGINIPSTDKLYLRFDVLFPKNFQFAKSGKLPGLAGGTSNSGGNPPNGYDGWSARSVWTKNGGLESYLYIPGIEKYGLELPWSVNGRTQLLTTDKWHCVVALVKLNTPGMANGILRGWIDTKLALDEKTINYRSTSNLNIDNIMFDTFFGGASPDFASPVTQQAYFDNIMVSKTQVGCERP